MAAASEIKLFGKWSFDEVEVSLRVPVKIAGRSHSHWHAAARAPRAGAVPSGRSRAALELLSLQNGLRSAAKLEARPCGLARGGRSSGCRGLKCRWRPQAGERSQPAGASAPWCTDGLPEPAAAAAADPALRRCGACLQVNDISLEDYIAVKPKYARFTTHSAGRFQKRRFRKAQCPIVERCVAGTGPTPLWTGSRADWGWKQMEHAGRWLAAVPIRQSSAGFHAADAACKQCRYFKE